MSLIQIPIIFSLCGHVKKKKKNFIVVNVKVENSCNLDSSHFFFINKSIVHDKKYQEKM
jgi:hypothetical protein